MDTHQVVISKAEFFAIYAQHQSRQKAAKIASFIALIFSLAVVTTFLILIPILGGHYFTIFVLVAAITDVSVALYYLYLLKSGKLLNNHFLTEAETLGYFQDKPSMAGYLKTLEYFHDLRALNNLERELLDQLYQSKYASLATSNFQQQCHELILQAAARGE